MAGETGAGGNFAKGLEGAGALPVDGFGVYVGEEGACDLGEDGVEVVGGLLEGARAGVDLSDGVVGDGGLGDGPEEGVVLVGGGKALGGHGEALCHAGREAEVDGDGEAGRGAEEGACDRVEDGGVEEAFAGAEVVAGYGKIGGGNGCGEGADGFGLERLGLRAEEDAAGGVVFLRELEGVEVVGRGKDPGAGGGGGGSVMEEAQRAA